MARHLLVSCIRREELDRAGEEGSHLRRGRGHELRAPPAVGSTPHGGHGRHHGARRHEGHQVAHGERVLVHVHGHGEGVRSHLETEKRIERVECV
jgi:hypothetical protein